MATVLSATGAITSLDNALPSASASAGAALPGYTTRTATATATLLSGTYYITTTYTYLTQTTPTTPSLTSPTSPTTAVSMTATGAATSTRRITSGSMTPTRTSLRTSTTSRATIAASTGGGGNRLPAGAITAIVIVSTLVAICLVTAWAYWYRRRNIRRRIAGQRVEVDGEGAVPSPISGGGWTTSWNRARSPPPPSYTQVRNELDTEKLGGTSAGTSAGTVGAAGFTAASGSVGRTASGGGGAGAASEGAPVSGYILEDDSSPTWTPSPSPSPNPNPATASASAPTPSPLPVLASVLRPSPPNPRRGDNHGESRVVVVEDGPARGIRESLASGRIAQADEASDTVLFPPTYGSLYPRGR